MPPTSFLPAWLYSDPAIADRERNHYANRCWHPVAATSELSDDQALARELLGMPLLLTQPAGGAPQAFLNRCPHRGVVLLEPGTIAQPCRRLVCPYHGWTYDLRGKLRAAAREAGFGEGFHRGDWPLQPLPCRREGPLIWVALAADPLPLETQLDLVLREAGHLWQQPRRLQARDQQLLACNWKVAHDNTLDDYHVAIAHPTTLHREQGPVRNYRHAFSRHGSLLATPSGEGGTFWTFGLVPWTHLLLWPDGRLALLQLVPDLHRINRDPSASERCRMDIWLLSPQANDPGSGDLGSDDAAAWMAAMHRFLEEDRQLVESAQRGYASGLQPGPPHRLEARILQWQDLYAEWMELDRLEPKPPARNHAAMAALISRTSATG